MKTRLSEFGKRTVALLLAFCLVGCGATAKRSIVVDALSGKVTSVFEQSSKELVKGEKLSAGESVTVHESSDLTLLLDADKHVFAESGTEFTLEAELLGTNLKLEIGKLTVSIDNKLGDDEYFEVTTHNAVMSVRGTVFTVEVVKIDGRYVTYLTVQSGNVEVLTYENGVEKKYDVGPGGSSELKGGVTAADSAIPEETNVEASDEGADVAPVPEPLDIDLSAYDNFGRACGGLIPVQLDGKWGALDYLGNPVIPCQHDYFSSANEGGYMIFSDGEYGYQYGTKTLYDVSGNVIVSGVEGLAASKEGYVTVETERNADDMYLGQTTYKYYRYDGSLITTISSGYFEYGSDDAHGFFEGKSIVTGNVKDDVWYRDDFFSGATPFDFGIVSADGSVEWIDGDGVNEDDTSIFMSDAEAQRAQDEYTKNLVGVGVSGGTTWVEIALSPMSHGYFITQNGGPAQEGFFLRDKDGVVAWFDPSSFVINGDKLEYTVQTLRRSGENKESKYIGGNNPDYDGVLRGHYQDGGYIYNYGSKVVVKQGEKYALIDLKSGEPEYKIFDYIDADENKYWLIESDGKWGYCDHDGNTVRFFDDAANFNNGHALIKDGDNVYMINEDFEKIYEFGPGDGVSVSGDLCIIYHGDERQYMIIK